MSALCCLPPFCISQETLPRVPSGFVFTTTKKYGSTGHIIYDIWSEVDLRMSSDNTGEIRNVFCKAGSSNFWTQRAFCSSANKCLSAAFSDTPKNRFTLAREVRILLFWMLQPAAWLSCIFNVNIYALIMSSWLRCNRIWVGRCFYFHSFELDWIVYKHVM